MKKIDKIIASLLTFIGLPGQILARIIYKHGSTDKLFLLLFASPPFSIIPSIAMWFGFIKDAKVKDKPFNLSLIVGMILMIIIPLILHKFIDNKLLLNTLIQVSIIGIIHYIYSSKFNRICSNKRKSNTAFAHALLLAPLSLLLGRILFLLLNSTIEKLQTQSKNIFDLQIFNNFIPKDYIDYNVVKLYIYISFSLCILYMLLNMFYSTNINNNIACNYKIKITHIVILIIINMLSAYIIKQNLLTTNK